MGVSGLRVASRATHVAPSIARRSFVASRSAFKKSGGHDLAEASNEGQIMIGPGAAPGTVPTDEDQSTGLERFELLHKLQGEEPFFNDPVEITHFGTMEKPIMIKSLFSTRIVGCTGLGDAHETLWMNIHKDKVGRCKECGIGGSRASAERSGEGRIFVVFCADTSSPSVYKLDFVGDEHAEEHH